jgi:hypothetical protein
VAESINNTKAYERDFPILCALTHTCGWRGMESDLVSAPHPRWPRVLQKVCPNCGSNIYIRRYQTPRIPNAGPENCHAD